MDLRDYLRVLRVHWRLILSCALLALSAAALVSLTTTPLYQSTTRLFVNAANDPGTSNVYTGSLFTQQRVKTYQQFVSSPTVMNQVRRDLGLDAPADALAREVSADSPLDTVLLDIHVKDRDPGRAQRLATATATAFSRLVGQIEQSPSSSATSVRLTTVQPATLPTHPVTPRTTLNLLLGALVGLALGVGAAVAREVLDTRVRTPGELEENFQLPTLTVIEHDKRARSRPLIVQDDPRSSRAEAIRRLRTNMQFVDVDRRPRSLVITSALPAEGKSTTTCNLAIALADAGLNVVLVDGDLRRPAVARYLGIEGAVGLTNVLVGQVPVEDALQDWGSTGRLRVLPSGTIPPNPSELLGSQQLIDLLRHLEGEALVLVDAPPLLPVTDGAVLAAHASGALLVIRVKHTRRESVKAALESLRNVGAHVVGAVLNMAPQRGPDAYANYGTYRYYGTPDDAVAGGGQSRRGTRRAPGTPPGAPAPGPAAAAGGAATRAAPPGSEPPASYAAPGWTVLPERSRGGDEGERPHPLRRSGSAD